MIVRRDVEDYLAEWHKRELPNLIERELWVNTRGNRAVGIIGPRRSGKTYYFYQLMKSLASKNNLYLNFEDVRLMNITGLDILKIIEIYTELFGNIPNNIFLDEIQNVQGWESCVRTLIDSEKYKIYLTGSSSKLLSREIATQLRGRTDTYILLPFSFREYIKIQKISYEEPLSPSERGILKNHLREYMLWGGFPEVVMSKIGREKTLREYFDMILFRDFVERHGIRNMGLARYILTNFFQNFSSEFSINKIYNKLRSMGISVGKNTLYDYIDKLEDTVSVFFLRKYSKKVHLRESWPKKVYVCDVGLTKMVRDSDDLGKIMENIVFLEFLRNTNINPLLEIYYYKLPEGEVDFLLKEGEKIKKLIQVVYASDLSEIREDEINNLLKASKDLQCRDLTVITWDFKEDIRYGEKIIRFVPLYEFLLFRRF